MGKFNVGDLCKHFKGKNLEEKNIYRILATDVTYSGEKMECEEKGLVVYENIFQKGKIFVREYADLVQELSKEKKEMYNQKYRVEKLTEEEIKTARSEEFKARKMKDINEK